MGLRAVLFISFSLFHSMPRPIWRRFIKDITIPHARPWLRFPICYPPGDLRPSVSGCPLLIIYHSTLVHCRLGRLFVLPFFAFHSQSQLSILLTLFQMFRIKNHINNSSWVRCPFFEGVFFYLHQLFFTFKKYIHIYFKKQVPWDPPRDWKNAFRYCRLILNGTHRFDFQFIPCSFWSFIFNVTYTWLLDFFKKNLICWMVHKLIPYSTIQQLVIIYRHWLSYHCHLFISFWKI